MKKIFLLIMVVLITMSICIYSFANQKKESIKTDNFEKQKEEAVTSESESMYVQTDIEEKTPGTESKTENNILEKSTGMLCYSNLIMKNVIVYGSDGSWEKSFGMPTDYDYYRVYYENNAPTNVIIHIKAGDKLQHVFIVPAYSNRTYSVKNAVYDKHYITISGKDGSVVKGVICVRISEKESY